MGCLVDFALEDLLSALHSECSDLAAQRFARLYDLLVRLGLRLRNDASGFGLSLCFDFVGDCDSALLGVGNTLLTVIACLGKFLVDALVSCFQFLLTLFSSRQTVSDLLRALV